MRSLLYFLPSLCMPFLKDVHLRDPVGSFGKLMPQTLCNCV